MRYQRKRRKGLYLSCILLGSLIGNAVFSNISIVSAKTEDVKTKQSYLFVFKEGSNLEILSKDIKNKYKNVNIDKIDDISAMRIESEDSKHSKNINNYISKKYKEILQDYSQENVIFTEPLIKPVGNMLQKGLYRSTALEEEDPYQKWGWDINKVTENGESYKIEEGNHEVKVAVIDSGLDFNHPDLKGNIIEKGKSFLSGITDTQDNLGHGTMVAGTIAANGKMKGIAPKVGIVPYKVFDKAGADSFDVIRAIIQAAQDNMDVINLSLGTYKSVKNKEERATYTSYIRAIDYAKRKGSVVVASSGTEENGFDISDPVALAKQRGFDQDAQYHIPGGLSNVITVSSSNKDDVLAVNSNYGSNITIGAPGGDFGPLWISEGKADVRYMTMTTYPTNLPQSIVSQYVGFEKGYELMVGTSLAAPKVSATAALIIAEYKERYGVKPSPAQVEHILYTGAELSTVVSRPNHFGHGIVNAKKSLDIVTQ
ncbi:S8 family serine peptidase [Bacillus paramycoides]|uniref:S8 family serine peptidase n=1 Tax=Bacillus paramycoides TaxID=2026194 RepID=UPI003D055571